MHVLALEQCAVKEQHFGLRARGRSRRKAAKGSALIGVGEARTHGSGCSRFAHPKNVVGGARASMRGE